MLDVLIGLLSGITGGVSVYYLPRALKAWHHKRKPILVHQFDDDGTDQGRRRVWHSFGKVVTDEDASNRKAWAHTAERIRDGYATCFGPYTKEIPFRGKYRVRFRIKALGINQSDRPIIMLDVTHGEKGSEDERVVRLGLPLVEKVILCNELPDGEYKDLDVDFEYDGESLIEFRCSVEDPEDFAQKAEQVLFDNVQVFHLSPII